jgi:hypothetical protein
VVFSRYTRILLLQHHRTRDHHGQRIVELMRYTGEQRPQSAELLALIQRVALPRKLGGSPLGLGDVAGDGKLSSCN